jgi:hypothetical protein
MQRIWRSIRLGLAALGLAGCAADSSLGPKVPDGAAPGLLGDVLGSLVRKDVLTRRTPLARDIEVSAVIGRSGGRLAIPAAGIEVIVPPRAVTSNTRFTLRAIAGTLVAYEFEPHGIRFRVPLVAKQDLGKTNHRLLSLRPLTAGYFAERSQLDLGNATALVSEVIQGLLVPLTGQFAWPIEHFSGYIVAY